MKKLLLLIVCLFPLLALAQQPFRTWTSNSGRTAVARLVGDNGQVVTLRLKSGKTLRIKKASLSAEDHAYIDMARGKAGGGGSSSVSPALTADWPGWRGPKRDGKSPDTGLLKSWPANGPERLWHARGLGKGFSTVAVVGGTVYASGGVNDTLTLFAFELDGKEKWKKELGPSWTKNYPGARATPVVDGGQVYLMSGHGVLHCLDASSGAPKWKVEMGDFGGRPGGWGYAESVLITPDAVIASPGNEYSIVALDKRSGKEKWKSRGNRGAAQYGSTILARHGSTDLLISGNHQGIHAVDPRNGDLLWENDFSAGNTANCPTPAYADGLVYWSNGYGKGGICLELSASGKSAKEAWRNNDLVNHHGGYIIHEGHIYGNHNSGWACLDLKTGQRKWQERGVGKGSCVYADGMLYTFSEDRGKMGLVECTPSGFKQTGEFSVEGRDKSWAHPVVIGGRLYLRFEDNLYCFNVTR